MLVHIKNVLTPEQIRTCVEALEAADWADGRETAGYLSQAVKKNEQLPIASPVARKLGEIIQDALDGNEKFISAALPLKVMPPFFNRYRDSGAYGGHIDGAIRPVGGTRIRTDLSATIFLSSPNSYEGGELIVEDVFGEKSVKLPAGDMILYPGTSVHRVDPVSKGTRLAAFTWIQSMVREDSKRTLLYEVDGIVQELGGNAGQHKAATRLAGVYHNLLRLWSDT